MITAASDWPAQQFLTGGVQVGTHQLLLAGFPAPRPGDQVAAGDGQFQQLSGRGPRPGVEITLALAAQMARLLQARGERQPQLLVFGSLQEEPAYARRVVKAAADLGIGDQVRFLDGVPLASHRAADGAWRLDEIDLLALASAAGGAVLFTPSVQDVETIGLGPALAALAGIPCAVTPYKAYDAFYRGALSDVRAHPGEEGINAAAEELLSLMAGRARRDPAVLSRLKSNHAALGDLFPVRPWLDLLQDLSSEFGRLLDGESPGGLGIPETRRQAG